MLDIAESEAEIPRLTTDRGGRPKGIDVRKPSRGADELQPGSGATGIDMGSGGTGTDVEREPGPHGPEEDET